MLDYIHTAILNYSIWNMITGVLMALATFLLVRVTRKLAQITEDHLAFIQEQAEYRVKIDFKIFNSPDGASFVGFALTNIGVPAITIIRSHIALGVSKANPHIAATYVNFAQVETYRDETIANFKPPHRLISGDLFTFLIDLKTLEAQLGPGRHIRYECQDSFGNNYISSWVNYYGRPITAHKQTTPGEGYTEPTQPTNPIRC